MKRWQRRLIDVIGWTMCGVLVIVLAFLLYIIAVVIAGPPKPWHNGAQGIGPLKGGAALCSRP